MNLFQEVEKPELGFHQFWLSNFLEEALSEILLITWLRRIFKINVILGKQKAPGHISQGNQKTPGAIHNSNKTKI